MIPDKSIRSRDAVAGRLEALTLVQCRGSKKTLQAIEAGVIARTSGCMFCRHITHQFMNMALESLEANLWNIEEDWRCYVFIFEMASRMTYSGRFNGWRFRRQGEIAAQFAKMEVGHKDYEKYIKYKEMLEKATGRTLKW